MATIDRGTIFVARESFGVWADGTLHRFRRGRTTIRAGHPLIEGNEARLEPLQVTYDVAPAPPSARPFASKAKPAGPSKADPTPSAPEPEPTGAAED